MAKPMGSTVYFTSGEGMCDLHGGPMRVRTFSEVNVSVYC